MDPAYAQTLRLLLTAAPDVFANTIFAMKGGTAINLFVQNMPRLSVDIDVVYLPWTTPRDEALHAIADELDAIARRLEKFDLRSRRIVSKGFGDTKLIVEDDRNQVKVEVNIVFRGTVLPPERRALCAKTAEMFSAELELPMLTIDELYGSKLVAAMDRQHPRDLFDMWNLYRSGGLSTEMVECFVTYLAGHNRPIHEVLFSNEKDIADEYHNSFVGMTTEEPITLETLLETRAQIRSDLPKMLTDKQRQFLVGLANAQPDWGLLKCPHAGDLPALRWKLANLHTFRKSRPTDFQKQAKALEAKLDY
ncbi:MAG: nucleotidyl transferase AbiEii/AbiGii toxin family protein [Gammaproteobacteria bacterium]